MSEGTLDLAWLESEILYLDFWVDIASLCTDARAIFRPTSAFSTVSERIKKQFMQMYTGTRLTTAIHRRLLSRFFLREGGRLYTGYLQMNKS